VLKDNNNYDLQTKVKANENGFTMSPDVVASADCACVMNKTIMATATAIKTKSRRADITACCL